MLILGIDPGLAQTGWGVVEAIGQRFRPVSFGTIRTVATDVIANRIHEIASQLGALAEVHRVEAIAMEDIFFTKNISSAIPVAKVIGAITHQLVGQGLTVRMFSPPQIKTAVTGQGNAEKHQVQEMVKLLLKLQEIPRPDHAADALAVAISYSAYSATEARIKQ